MLPQKIYKIFGYIDDSYLQGTGYDQCLGNAKDTVTLLNKLELLIHPDKSVLYPTQQIVFFGVSGKFSYYVFTLTTERASQVKDACANLLHNLSPTIREVL